MASQDGQLALGGTSGSEQPEWLANRELHVPHCTHHCSACGAHFVSLRAFDSHRAGRHGARRCEEPTDLRRDGQPVLEPKTEAGRCDLAKGDPLDGVTVWRLASA